MGYEQGGLVGLSPASRRNISVMADRPLAIVSAPVGFAAPAVD